jgi:NAD/NADP transhydrogenase beta subunit
MLVKGKHIVVVVASVVYRTSLFVVLVATEKKVRSGTIFQSQSATSSFQTSVAFRYSHGGISFHKSILKFETVVLSSQMDFEMQNGLRHGFSPNIYIYCTWIQYVLLRHG